MDLRDWLGRTSTQELRWILWQKICWLKLVREVRTKKEFIKVERAPCAGRLKFRKLIKISLLQGRPVFYKSLPTACTYRLEPHLRRLAYANAPFGSLVVQQLLMKVSCVSGQARCSAWHMAGFNKNSFWLNFESSIKGWVSNLPRQQQCSSVPWSNRVQIVGIVFGLCTASSMSKRILHAALSDPDVPDAGAKTKDDEEPAKSRDSFSDYEGH